MVSASVAVLLESSVEQSYQSPPLVMDTNVLVAGTCRHESSMAYRLLFGVLDRKFPIVVTEPIVLEYLSPTT
jgi:hypothetical protein